MNERQPYERHLAEKLQNLPPPGEVDQSWEQMRTLLDKEMPRGGGMPGRRHWWLFGIAIGVLFMATWLAGGSLLDSKKAPSVAQTTPADPGNSNVALPGDKVQSVSAAPQPATADGSQPANDIDKDNEPVVDNNAAGATDKGVAQSRGEPADNAGNKSPGSDEGTVATAPGNTNKINHDLSNNRQPNANDAISTLKNNRTGNRTKNLTPPMPGRKQPAGTRGQNSKPDDGIALNKENKAGNKTGSRKPANDASRRLTDGSDFWSKPFVEQVHSTTVRPPLKYVDKPGPVLDPATTIEKDYAQKSSRLPQPPPAKAAAKKKVQRSHEAGVLAVGFTLPLAFPLGDQRAMGYNLWAGHNTVSDYMPSPHLQYHLSSKTFLQTEAQLMSPQFIRSTLLYHTTTPMGPSYQLTNSVYAKKLYYFNIPVSIHHSPFPGFYMGTGLQFSSMISGVALTEERKLGPGGSNVLLRETYTRFKNDSLSQRINGSEFRVLLDANYYFDRFTVGLRYNQALSNYISFRLASAVPYSFDKNRALQFYLRYNLWEDRKRASNINKTMLTLK